MFEARPFPRLNLPPVPLRLRTRTDECGTPVGLDVYDPLRRKFVALTPEEYVRQHFTAWLISDYGYPPQLMNNEVSLRVGGVCRRCDTLVYNSQGEPFIVVEYKETKVKITPQVFRQIALYNMVLHAKYLIVSNGLEHYCCQMNYDNGDYQFVENIPIFK